MMFSPHDPARCSSRANRVFRRTTAATRGRSISPDLTTNADRNEIVDDGRARHRDPHRRATTASRSGRRSSRSPNRRSRPGVYFTGTRRRRRAACRRDGGKTWTNITDAAAGLPEAGLRVRGRAVAVRREHGVRHRRRPSAERLQDLHLGEHRLRRDVPVAQREPARRGRADADRGHEERRTCSTSAPRPGIFLTLDRGKSWRRLKAQLADGARRRDDDSSARQRADRRHARPRDLDSRSSRADPGVRGGAGGDDRREAVHGSDRRCSGASKDDQNDEFWGHQFFVGENPPTDAVIQFHLKKPVDRSAAARSPTRRAARCAS